MTYNRKYINRKVRVKTEDEVLAEARQAMKEIGEEARKNGTADMTMDEIDAIIAQSRKERQENKGAKHGG